MSDEEIITMLEHNNPLAWESLYDKYAPAIFGLICKLTDDKVIAEKMLISSFLQLKQSKILSKVKYALYPAVLRYVLEYTTQKLTQNGVTPKILKPLDEMPVMHLICTQSGCIHEISSILNITTEEAKRRLRFELLYLRNQKNIAATVHVSDNI